MKKLMQFLRFDGPGFFGEKKLMVTACKPWADFKTKEELGTKVEVVIIEDNTAYRLKDGEQVSNIYEKVAIKVAKQLTVPTGTVIELVNPVCTVYGDYRDKLSVTVDDVKVVGQNNQTK